MPPEFNKSAKDILGKRAALLCSNPGCRTTTSGPTSDPQKALNIGEAAHIYGAFPGAARYRDDMTDWSRAEITNGIWLCRNCHKLVDNDPYAFPAEVLFKWRVEHERHVLERLGSRTDIIRSEIVEETLARLFGESLLAKQIARERLPFWEYRLTAELLRFNLKPASTLWIELKSNLRVRPLQPLDDDNVLTWFRMKIQEASGFIDPLATLYTVELEKSWGIPGQPGDVEAIARACRLLGDLATELVRWEESVRFVWTSESYRGLIDLLRGIVGKQLEKLVDVSEILDRGVDRAEENPSELTEVNCVLVFDLPENWTEAVNRELQKIERETGLEY